jgi:PAS domain S-box-containing protein
LESLSEGVIITDRESRVLFANRRMEEMTGWTPGELVGRISYEVLAPRELWAAMRRRLEERLAGEEEAYENELVRKDGSRHWIQVRASPYRDSAGRIQGTIGAMSCIQRQKELEQENSRLLDVLAAERGFPDIVGNSPALRKVLEQVTMVGATDASVLILGESGTGKELVARAIHEAGTRRERPLVRVNCASIPKELFESEFFGHVKGAFTGAIRDRMGRFEMADRGTLFLDEVGEIPADLQAGRKDPSGGCADHRSDESGSVGDGAVGGIPAGFVLPAERVPDGTAALARASGGYPTTRGAFPGPSAREVGNPPPSNSGGAMGSSRNLRVARERA